MHSKINLKTRKEFNKRFANGEQYIFIDAYGKIEYEPKQYFWQERAVYNHIMPIVQLILSKYTKIDKNLIYGKNGLVEQLMPFQKAYNALKNRKHEYLNRLSMGVLTVEDGSVDIESLEQEGLQAGKILVYRQGSNPPEILKNHTLNQFEEQLFDNEEANLLKSMFSIKQNFYDVLCE